MRKITEKGFTRAVGRAPDPNTDDMDRTNCKRVGTPGHTRCGWCLEHQKPRFICGCEAKERTVKGRIWCVWLDQWSEEHT